ncbi:MAG: glycosyltransferase family 4 protein [bacterium]|nr:glycosyltransferase family 4 protein [bacterium]
MDTKRIKICQVVSADISLKFLLLEYMKYLQQGGFEVQAVSSQGKWVAEIEKQGIPVHTVEITRKLFTPIADLIALVRLIAFFRRERFDIVHTHTPKASFLGQIAAFFVGVPVRVTTIHGLYFQEDSSLRKKIIFMPIEWIIARIVHLAFSVNREDIASLLKKKMYSPHRVLYLGGGINVDHFNPSRFSKEFILRKRQEIGISPNALIVGIVARLVKEKGFLPLFAAFAEVRERFPNAVLLVVGPYEPEKQDALDVDVVQEYGIQDHVLFLGERVDVVELYAVMDVFVLPSYREGLGLSVLEASAMKRPVVASDIRGCREGVEHGRTGLLVPSANSAKLAEALIYILSHAEEGGAMGEAGRKKVEREFNEKTMFAKMKQEYERLIAEGSQAAI